MFKIIRIAISLNRKPRLILSLFFIFTLLATILEIFSIGVILPLLQSIMSGDESFVFIFKDIKFFETSMHYMLVVFVFLFFLKNIYLVFYHWWISKFTWNIYSSTSSYLLKKYLSNDFSFFKRNNISQLVQYVFIETKNFTGTFSSSLIIIFEFLVLASIIFLLLTIQFQLTLITIFSFGFVMLLYHKLFTKMLAKWGALRVEYSTKSLKTLNEIFGGIKTIKIFKAEKIFSNIFSKYINQFSSIAIKHGAFTNYPKIVLEMSAIVIIFTTLMFLNYAKADVSSLIPFFGVFIAASFRILPSINKLMQGFNNISFHHISIDMMKKEYAKKETIISTHNNKNIIFNKNIEIKNLTYSHNQKDIIYENENMAINKYDCVGIFGESGSGKTTLVDIIMGLNTPDKGEIMIDGKKIETRADISSWQKKISYVPQPIFLFNGTLKNNVSFEFDEDLINENKVINCIKNSQLEKFLNKSEKINYKIDEGGGNVSIGEKQRIGLARALYKDPELIILDEPTTALDAITSKNLIKFLTEFRKNRTLIIISHDLNSLKMCNKIYEVRPNEKGKNKIILKDNF